MTEPVELALLEVEGKLYLNAAAWPVMVYVDRVAVKKVDPRRITWDGQKLKLWLENANAVYTLAPEDEGKDDIVTLHRLVTSTVGAIPGHPLSEPEPAAPDPIVVSTSALEADGLQRVTPPVDRIITAKNLPPPLATGPVTSPFTSDFGTHKGTFPASDIFARALSDAQGMGVAGYAIPSSNNFHGLMHPTGGNAAGYGNVRYFTSQDTFPVTPYRDLRHLQAEVDTMRAKLVSALEMQHTQYLMESPASAALALESSASRWRMFLTDIGGYLNFVQGICQKLATMSYKNTQGEESRVWLTEPLAAQGRLSEFEQSYQSERQPKEVTLKEMMGEMGRAAEMLGGQATSLLGIVAPTPPPKDDSLASTLDVDERAFSDIEKAIAAKAPDVPYERNWDDPGNGGNGQMGGDDGG